MPPYFVKDAVQLLAGTAVKVITVAGFPFGYSGIAAKVEETKRAMDDGADEIDLVMNVAAFLDGNVNYVKNEIISVCTVVHMRNKKLKVILETALLNEAQIRTACEIAIEAEADFIKTSTGFASRGVSLEDIHLLKNILPSGIRIKASGGIKTREFALELIEAGASRLGTSAGIALL